jgi:hypothetical protein
MGTIIGLIERYCSHLTQRLKKDIPKGRRYDAQRGERLSN